MGTKKQISKLLLFSRWFGANKEMFCIELIPVKKQNASRFYSFSLLVVHQHQLGVLKQLQHIYVGKLFF
jgi:hypothetical protein